MCGPPPPGIHTFVFVLVPVVISPATAGIWAGVSATVSTPPCSPKRWLLSPGPCPGCIGTLPRISGRANVVLPSPPYVVPNRANRAAFDIIGRTCPLQYSQPSGSKFPPNMRMVPKKASIIETILISEQLYRARRVPRPARMLREWMPHGRMAQGYILFPDYFLFGYVQFYVQNQVPLFFP